MLTQKIHHFLSLIRQAEQAYQRPPLSVTCVAVSKTQPAKMIEQAYLAGLHDFAENYWQEAQEKMKCLHHLPIQWHFIGAIQSNKAALISINFSWVHSVDRLKIARLLNEAREKMGTPLFICLQIKMADDDRPTGITVEKAPALIEAITTLPYLSLRGLMLIPSPNLTPAKRYQQFCYLAHLLQQWNQQFNLSMDTLSMGMSDDFIPAIEAGSTIVRIGSALFGERT